MSLVMKVQQKSNQKVKDFDLIESFQEEDSQQSQECKIEAWIGKNVERKSDEEVNEELS